MAARSQPLKLPGGNGSVKRRDLRLAGGVSAVANLCWMDDRRQQCAQIFEAWHDLARTRDVDGLLDLYKPDAVFESPLVPAILDDTDSGRLQGHEEIRPFLAEGTRRRPNDLVRWFRTGDYLCDGRTLFWEYPREAPDGHQIDIAEVMEIDDGLIQEHRIYWGWFGIGGLIDSAVGKVDNRA